MSDEDGVVLSVQESRSIPEGTHTGRIRELSTRPDTPYGPYLDIEVDILDMESEDAPLVLGDDSVGFPAKITEQSWLGQLLEKFGANLGEPGEQIDVAEVLEGRAVQFETEDENTEHGTFASILKKTVRPHPDYDEEDVWGQDSEEETEQELDDFED